MFGFWCCLKTNQACERQANTIVSIDGNKNRKIALRANRAMGFNKLYNEALSSYDQMTQILQSLRYNDLCQLHVGNIFPKNAYLVE